MVHAQNFFSGITLGAGYAKNKVANDGTTEVRLDGYSIFSRGYLVKSYKDYLFTDFRVNSLSKSHIDLTQYQASVGLGYPFHVSNGITMKPYLQTGWSWNTAKVEGIGKSHDNGILLGTGLETQFGKHFVSNIGFSIAEGDHDISYSNAIFDLGYKF